MRRILHHGPTPDGPARLISDRAVAGCWFELNRQGGCGQGEVVLDHTFEERHAVETGDWISIEPEPGRRWYLGRVEERRSRLPALVRLRLDGMVSLLNEVFPGGLGGRLPGDERPHRFGRPEDFQADPDALIETVDPVVSVREVISTLASQYIVPRTPITFDLADVRSMPGRGLVDGMTFRGEESVRSILKDLAIRSGSVAWGVDEIGRFFFRPGPEAEQVRYRSGVSGPPSVVRLEETTSRDSLYNRLQITGDFLYDPRPSSGSRARRVSRWRGHFGSPQSAAEFGERRLRLWLPWIRSQADGDAFAREFLRQYARPVARTMAEVSLDPARHDVPRPWEGPVVLENARGEVLAGGSPSAVRVEMDHGVLVRLEVGPEDPRSLWPEPPQDERYERPDQDSHPGGTVSEPPSSQLFSSGTPGSGGGGGGGGGSSSHVSSAVLSSVAVSSFASSDASSVSSDSSENSAQASSGVTSQTLTSLISGTPSSLGSSSSSRSSSISTGAPSGGPASSSGSHSPASGPTSSSFGQSSGGPTSSLTPTSRNSDSTTDATSSDGVSSGGLSSFVPASSFVPSSFPRTSSGVASTIPTSSDRSSSDLLTSSPSTSAVPPTSSDDFTTPNPWSTGRPSSSADSSA